MGAWPETELLTTFVHREFLAHKHEFRDVSMGHDFLCGLIFQRCSYFVFCVRLVLVILIFDKMFGRQHMHGQRQIIIFQVSVLVLKT